MPQGSWHAARAIDCQETDEAPRVRAVWLRQEPGTEHDSDIERRQGGQDARPVGKQDGLTWGRSAMVLTLVCRYHRLSFRLRARCIADMSISTSADRPREAGRGRKLQAYRPDCARNHRRSLVAT